MKNFKEIIAEKNIIKEALFDVSAVATIIDGEYKGKRSGIGKPVSAKDEKEAEKKFLDSTKLQQKNGHLPKNIKVTNIKIKKM